MRFAEHVANHAHVMKIGRNRTSITRYGLNRIYFKPALEAMRSRFISLLRKNAARDDQLVAIQVQRSG